MEKEPKLFRSSFVEGNEKTEKNSDLEEEVFARMKEIEEGNCVIGEGKTAKVFICEKDPWSCYKTISSSYYPRLRVDHEMKYMDEVIRLKIRVPLPLFAMIHGDMEVLAMERVNGHSVREIINGEIDLPENFNLNNFFQEIADFLKAMHRHRIFHRDLHEGNIMIDDSGKPWIIDFGDACHAFSEEEAYISNMLNPETRKMESVKYTSDENNLTKIRASLRKYILNQKANS